MPDQCVTTNLHVVALCIADNRIGGSKVECATQRLGRIPFHFVTWRETSKLSAQEVRVLRSTEEATSDSGTKGPTPCGSRSSESDRSRVGYAGSVGCAG